MHRWQRAHLMPLWTVFVHFAACSGGSKAKPPSVDAAGEQPAVARTCQEAKNCSSQCTDDQLDCLNTCRDVLDGDARAAFQALIDCTTAACGGWKWDCICTEQCYGDGVCLPQSDVCAAGATDVFCETACH